MESNQDHKATGAVAGTAPSTIVFKNKKNLTWQQMLPELGSTRLCLQSCE
jgi:hypothetical protein